jgi:general stress protein YciG
MQSGTQNRGFASMDRERQREIARKGGKAAHEKGTAHEFTADEARAAGRKGGERVSADRAHMSRIGRLGGTRSAGRRTTKPSPEGGSEVEVAPGNAENATSSAPYGRAAEADLNLDDGRTGEE